MKMKNFSLSLVAVLAMSTFAVAGGDMVPVVEPLIEVPVIIEEEDNSKFYLGLGYSYVEEDFDVKPDFDETYSMDSVMFQAGYQFNPYFAIEARYWMNGSDFEVDSSGADISGDFTAWGIYAKPQYPVTESLNIYALLGYASTSLEPDIEDINYLDTDSFSWGVGIEYMLTENFALFLDYTNLAYIDEFTFNGVDLPDNDVESTISSINFGLTYKF